eukprot:CAMPEP_0201630026 /NCGR_PEP_ID=MMETSP0493-20130528/4485_1 /ASSEMBLY_ACC=CAM_ASM_000838 /TAXON_ID=420259 /ORGANISM="Thalassiosira gravida, Strain GMp14c1" /LENGTH=44 /DNA_ID= /DNA_START= /DNA_END= /DNA_ORIENTATION=
MASISAESEEREAATVFDVISLVASPEPAPSSSFVAVFLFDAVL